MNDLKIYFSELYAKKIDKSDYEPLLQHLSQFNHALVTIKQEERMTMYDIIDILINLQIVCENKKLYDFCLAIEISIVCYESLINLREMDDLSSYNFAYYYYMLENYKESYFYAKTCYKMRKKKYSDQDQKMKDTISILKASFYQLDDSLFHLKEGYELYKDINGEEDEFTLSYLNDLALGYYNLGDYEHALQYGEKLYQQYHLLYGDKDNKTLMSLVYLAMYYDQLGDDYTALNYALKVYKCLDDNHPYMISVLHNLSCYYRGIKDYVNACIYATEAYEKAKDTLSDDDPNMITIYTNFLDICGLALGDEVALNKYFDLYQQEKSRYDKETSHTLSILIHIAQIYYRRKDFDKAYEYALDSYTKAIDVFGKSHHLTLQILGSLIACDKYKNKNTLLYCRQYLTGFLKQLHNTNIINNKEALRKFLKYERHVYPVFVELFFDEILNKETIDYDLLLKYKNLIYDIEYLKTNKNYHISDEVTLQAIQNVLPQDHLIMDIYSKGLLIITKTETFIYKSLENTTLPNNIKHIYICPDANLYDVSFAEVFPDYDVSYLSSPKSLLYQNSNTDAGDSVSMVCPDFNIYSNTFDDDSLKGSRRNNLFGGFIEEKYLKDKYMNLKVYERYQANYDNFISIKSPRILHISTHGGYLDDLVTDNSMLKGVLYLSGCNNISQGEIIDNQYGEGYISANDIQFMDLSGTDLVVLSACSTAKGTTIDNEGIYGLRRAFELAGAKSLLITLDEVDDFNAAIFIKTFFRFYQDHPYEALKQTKTYLKTHGIEELEKLKDDFIEIFHEKDHHLNEDYLLQLLDRIDYKINQSLEIGSLIKNYDDIEDWRSFIIQGRI